jgi:ribosomal protein S18 acetylase RimI-like enzyme
MADVIQASEEAAAIRRADRRDAPALVRTLARAFFDDPISRWVTPQERSRLRRLERAFDVGVRKVYLRDGDCWTTEGVAGAALWLPPGGWIVPPGRQLRLLPGMVRAYGRDLPRALRAFQVVAREHPHAPHHWYLPFIGVDPDWQGKGIGTALLQPVLERCDRERLPAYLEASTPRNRACYERSGFHVTGTIDFPDGPTMWKMWREPRG